MKTDQCSCTTAFPFLYSLGIPVCYCLWLLISGFIINTWSPLKEPISRYETWYFLTGGSWIGVWNTFTLNLYLQTKLNITVSPSHNLILLIINILSSMMILLFQVTLEIPWSPAKPFFPLVLYLITTIAIGFVACVLGIKTIQQPLKVCRFLIVGTVVGWTIAVMLDITISIMAMSTSLTN